MYAANDTTVSFTTGEIAFYGELKTHKGAVNLGGTGDLFHTNDANAYCSQVVRRFPYDVDDPKQAAVAASAVLKGAHTGGTTSADGQMNTIQMGGIASGIRTGGDTNPELFVAGLGYGKYETSTGRKFVREAKWDPNDGKWLTGTDLPAALVFVNG
ncbi:TPA: hypothetical protein ACS52A_004795, partial [Salmonella enterica]